MSFNREDLDPSIGPPLFSCWTMGWGVNFVPVSFVTSEIGFESLLIISTSRCVYIAMPSESWTYDEAVHFIYTTQHTCQDGLRCAWDRRPRFNDVEQQKQNNNDREINSHFFDNIVDSGYTQTQAAGGINRDWTLPKKVHLFPFI
jgi:hypothetical protein